MTILSDGPARLIGGVLGAAVLLALLSGVLAWHGLRRLMDVPRVPRPAAMYLVLAGLWGLAATACAATVIAVLLLRDHKRVEGRTAIGEVRCEPGQPGHVRIEVNGQASPSGQPERYEIAGDSCTLSVREVELRPGLQALGVTRLARVDGFGQLTRPAANPGWLTPTMPTQPGLLGLVVRRTEAVSLVVPADAKPRALIAAPGRGVVLEPPPS
jgi:hypothetical protein